MARAKKWLSGIILVGLVGLLAAAPAAQAQDTPESAKITLVTNDKEAFRKAPEQDYQQAEVNEPVKGGDSLKTEKSRIEVTLDAGKLVRMDENTVLDLLKYFEQEADKKKIELNLEQGDVWSNLSGIGEDTEFNINSPIAGAAVRGTVFSLSVGEGNRTELQVYEGSVEVYNPTPAPKGPGEPASLEPKSVKGPGEVGPPKEVTPKEWTAIVGANQKLVLTPNEKKISVTEITPADIQAKKDWIEWNRQRDKELGLK